MKNEINMQDLVYLERLLRKSEDHKLGRPINKGALKADFAFQALTFFLASGLLFYEVYFDQSITKAILVASQDQELGLIGLKITFGLLIFVLCGLYYLSLRAAKKSEQNTEEFLSKNFAYLKNLSLISDLVIKFLVSTFAVLGGFGNLVAGLLVLFISDYLIQKRLFHLNEKASKIISALCVVLSGAMLFLKWSSVGISLVVYLIVIAFSLKNIFEKIKSQ